MMQLLASQQSIDTAQQLGHLVILVERLMMQQVYRNVYIYVFNNQNETFSLVKTRRQLQGCNVYVGLP